MDFLVLFPSGCFYVQKHIGQRFAITETTWLRVEVCFPIECFRLNPNYLWTLMLNLRFTKESVRSPLTLIDHWLWSGWLICFRPRTLRGTISPVLFMVLPMMWLISVLYLHVWAAQSYPDLHSCWVPCYHPFCLFPWLLSCFLHSTAINFKTAKNCLISLKKKQTSMAWKLCFKKI